MTTIQFYTMRNLLGMVLNYKMKIKNEEEEEEKYVYIFVGI